MERMKKSSELLWIFGIVFVSLGVAICNKADLGVSMIAAPAFVISEALINISPFFNVGVTEYIIQGLLLITMCIVVQRFDWRYLFTFAVAVIYGYTLNLFLYFFDSIVFEEVWLRWIMLIIGDLVTGFGVACFFRTYLPLQVYELFVSEISKRFKFNINKTKWIFDISLLLISLVLSIIFFGDLAKFDFSTICETSFHSIGLGTILTTLINSPIITLAGKLVDKIFEPTPLFPRLESAVKYKS